MSRRWTIELFGGPFDGKRVYRNHAPLFYQMRTTVGSLIVTHNYEAVVQDASRRIVSCRHIGAQATETV